MSKFITKIPYTKLQEGIVAENTPKRKELSSMQSEDVNIKDGAVHREKMNNIHGQDKHVKVGAMDAQEDSAESAKRRKAEKNSVPEADR